VIFPLPSINNGGAATAAVATNCHLIAP
jgi:hypothetical protein